MTEAMRLHRALARAGVASRRKAEELIAAGRVRVNGRVATVGESVDPSRDEITVDGRRVDQPAEAQWFVLHKPAGYVTTRTDPQQRRTVFDLVPKVAGLTYVGRLDYLTEGVLLLTSDGDAVNRLTHPSREIERTYVATVHGDARAAQRDAAEGVELEDGVVTPRDVQVRQVGRGKFEFELTIAEGRNREVRRLCEALGLDVERLVRTRFGPVRLGELPPGQVRSLTGREAAAIEALTGVRVPRTADEGPRRTRPAGVSGKGPRKAAPKPRDERGRTSSRKASDKGPRAPSAGRPDDDRRKPAPRRTDGRRRG